MANFSTVDDSGYESETGPRDIPTADDFANDRPVKSVIGCSWKQQNKRALNRRGRAICRILHAHGWSERNIAKIFGGEKSAVNRGVINKAINNVYVPRDDEAKDYHYAGEDYREKFPNYTASVKSSDSAATSGPASRSPSSAATSVSISPRTPSVKKRARTEGSDTMGSSQDSKRARVRDGSETSGFATSTESISMRRKLGSVMSSYSPSSATQVQTPVAIVLDDMFSTASPRPSPGRRPDSLSDFLLYFVDTDLRAHRELLHKRGFNDISKLCAMAEWLNDDQLRDALRAKQPEGSGCQPGELMLSGFTETELIALELGIKKLKR
ncbi:hypothetical protein C8F04DRAFT_1080113 [Mycena alexandri]|uniref:Uncharacterized protein n=1 Tax=Mycena alexandri TaxID=1745969 RepID=A0AAD6TAF1_9AGAR|nr:hypothetical protein C8F04DRAFT_1080113 [Mycena alexandri]